MCEVLDRVENRGIEKGMALMRYLLNDDRLEDARRAAEDEAYRQELLEELFGAEKQEDSVNKER